MSGESDAERPPRALLPNFGSLLQPLSCSLLHWSHFLALLMSSQPLSSQHKAKKRKHVGADIGPSEPSAKRSKKEGKHKKDKRHKEVDGQFREKRKDKGKAREDEKQFKVISATLAISIPPVFANNLRAGAEEMLDSMIMRYVFTNEIATLDQ